DQTALRLDPEATLALLLRELTPVGTILDHQVPASGHHEPEAQPQDAAQHPHAHADPLARFAADPVALGLRRGHVGRAPTHGNLRSATVGSSLGSLPTSG